MTQTQSAPKALPTLFRPISSCLDPSTNKQKKSDTKILILLFYFFLSPTFCNTGSRNHHEFILNNECQNSAAASDVATVVGPIPIPGLDTIPPSDTVPIPIPTPPVPIPVPDPADAPGAGPGPEPDPGAEADPEVGAELAEVAVGEMNEETEGKEDEEGLAKGNAWRKRCSRSVRDAGMCMYCFFFRRCVYQIKGGVKKRDDR